MSFESVLVGTDIEKIDRFPHLLQNESFMNGVFTDRERRYIDASHSREQTAAGIYCAKEAAAKAFGRGFFGIVPKELEILHDGSGAPYLTLSGDAEKHYGAFRFSLSISHDADTAIAVVVALK